MNASLRTTILPFTFAACAALLACESSRAPARTPTPPASPATAALAQTPAPGGSVPQPTADVAAEGGAGGGGGVPQDPAEAPTTDVAGPQVTIELETPYKMDERAQPKTQEEYKTDILDRRHWNSGGMGELIGEPPGAEGHPDPRVIVNIDKARGPHKAKVLQRVARKYHWINSVRCYRLGAYKDRHLRGWTKARMTVSASGKVVKPRLLKTELKDREVAACLVDKLKTLKFPRARGGTRAWIDMKVGPGDEPMPPPKDLIVPGDGELPLDAMKKGVEAGHAAFEACYRAAFEYAPGLWGRIIIRFHLTERGTLDEAFEAGSRFPDARVRQCVMHAARKLTFPRPKGGDVRFVVPLRFHTDAADTARPTK